MTSDERERLRAALAAPGFDVVRFAAVAPVRAAGDFRAWLEAGHQADMHWLPRTAEKRLDPQLVLPGARSIILLGVNYLPAGEAATQQRWAKYALWLDYHDTMAAGLRAAAAVLEAQCGLSRLDHRVYVDAGPVLERGWAAVSGMGWRGKNAMLISRTHGNWLFLAAILARCEIPADQPMGPRGKAAARPNLASGSLVDVEKQAAGMPVPVPPGAAVRDASGAGETAPPVGQYCGSCTRCLVACPTDAFPRPGWVDARRCIAYHTIENRGMIPRELRAHFGGRVFGCDVCLDVCPWNRFAQTARSALLAAREAIVRLSLLDLLAMDAGRFRDVFRKSPIKRVKLAGILRNACIAAGNWDDTPDWHFGGAENREAVIAAVETLCLHDAAIVRAHAVWALSRLLGAQGARTRLTRARQAERDRAVLEEYEEALPQA